MAGKKVRFVASLVRLGLLASLLRAAAAQDQPKPAEPNQQPDAPVEVITDPTGAKLFAFKTNVAEGMDLTAFIKTASRYLNRPFTWSPPVKSQITGKKIQTTTEQLVPEKELLPFVETYLRIHDLAVVPVGPPDAEIFVVDAVNTAAFLRNYSKFVPYEELRDYKDRYILITTSIPVKYLGIDRIQSNIQRLQPQAAYGAALIPVPSTNSIIVTDFGPIVWKTAKLIEEMDQREKGLDPQLEIIPLENAGAEELQPLLEQLIQARTPGQVPGVPPGGIPGLSRDKPEPKIIADPRTNSLVVQAAEEDMKKIREMIQKLDSKVAAESGNILIYPLKHTVAKELSETLKEIAEGQRGSAAPAILGQPGQRGTVQRSSSDTEVQIVPDDPSNTLLIRGPKTKVQDMVKIIEELDKRKSQVLVEAAIVELSERAAASLAIELASFRISTGDATLPFGFTSFGLSQVVLAGGQPVRVPVGVPLGAVPGSLPPGLLTGVFRTSGTLFPVIITAVATDQKSNLLSMPSVLTNDNEGAQIRVADEVPTSTLSQLGAQTTAPNVTTTFGGYQSAELLLNISPHISAEEQHQYLRLDINFKVEAFTAAPDPRNQLPPPRISREITTVVNAPSESVVVIGGLTTDDDREVVSKVPILGDIPIIKYFFRSSTRDRTKRNLYLFLAPRILRDVDFHDLKTLSDQRKLEVARLEGQIFVVEPRFADRVEIKDGRYSLKDLQGSGAFDFPRYRSPTEPPAPGPGAPPPPAGEGGEKPPTPPTTPPGEPSPAPPPGERGGR